MKALVSKYPFQTFLSVVVVVVVKVSFNLLVVVVVVQKSRCCDAIKVFGGLLEGSLGCP